MEEVKLLVDNIGDLFVQFQDGQIAQVENYYDIVKAKVWDKHFPNDKAEDSELI